MDTSHTARPSELPVYPAEVREYFQAIRSRHSPSDITRWVESLRELRVLVVGDAILDEYVYGEVIGKSAKEPILAMRYVSQEMHAGGSLVIANHVAGFCRQVDLLTYLGELQTREEFVRGALHDNVQPCFVYKPGSPTIVKRRYVENYLLGKLLEVYEMNDTPLEGPAEEQLCAVLEARLPDYDVVIAADYGHGLLTAKAIELLARRARFLAVNTQINAANLGYHALSKYPRAHHVCVHEGELRLDQRDRVSDLRALMVGVAQRMDARSVLVTRGKHGTLLYRVPEGVVECPAFSVRVVDRVGAGDSVLAISSLCAAREVPADVLSFLANLVGAQAVTIVGNRTAIQRERLLDSIATILQ